MLSNDRKYLWQLIEASTGRRSEPFIATPTDFRETLLKPEFDNLDAHYVLCLADVGLEIKPQEFVSRFPIYRASTFLTLDLNKLLKPEFLTDDEVTTDE